MIGFLIAVCFMAWICSIFASITFAMEREKPIFYWLGAFIFTLGLGVCIQGMIDETAKGPCVQYETQLHYNAATKTTMPAKVCVNRGEWVTE